MNGRCSVVEPLSHVVAYRGLVQFQGVEMDEAVLRGDARHRAVPSE
jgi:hypothetical protein